MASNKKRRTPHNIYTEKRAEQQFQDFIQHTILRNLPIPESILSPSRLPQVTDDNRVADPKRRKHTLLEVCQLSYFFGHF